MYNSIGTIVLFLHTQTTFNWLLCVHVESVDTAHYMLLHTDIIYCLNLRAGVAGYTAVRTIADTDFFYICNAYVYNACLCMYVCTVFTE